MQVSILMIESDHQIATVAVVVHRGTVHGNDVEFPVVVTINEANAAAGGFNNIVLLWLCNI
jgi:hypothetical protein